MCTDAQFGEGEMAVYNDTQLNWITEDETQEAKLKTKTE